MRYVWMAIVIALFAATAKAKEVEEGTGVVCDTQAQVERFAELDGTIDALNVINAGAQRHVCTIAQVHYIRGKDVSRVSAAAQTVQVTEILVVQVNLYGRWTDIAPSVQYTLFAIDEEGA